MATQSDDRNVVRIFKMMYDALKLKGVVFDPLNIFSLD